MHQLSLFDYNALDSETRIVVQQRTSEIKTLMRRTAQDIIDIGAKLIDVKQRLGHGRFGGWLNAEFGWSESAALKMMQVTGAFKSVNFTDLNFGASALYLLAAPSTPDEARAEALERAAAGETITHTIGREIVTTHKSAAAYDDEDDEEITRRYEGGLATCKYCYATHDHWVLSGDHDSAWTCRECGGATSDEFMELVESEFYVRDEDFPNRARPQDVDPYPAHQIVWERPPLIPDTVIHNSIKPDISGLPPQYHGHRKTESNDYYTPGQYIEAARCVLGTIDLDPASCAQANETVKAARYFTIDDDGLSQDWSGRVWLNPPYGRNENGKSNQHIWAHHLVRQYRHGAIDAAVLLVSANTDCRWFQVLWNYPMVFTPRINFYAPDNQRKTGPNHGSVLVYMGENTPAFVAAMRPFGRIVVPQGTFSEVLP